MSDDRFFDRLRADAAPLRYEPDPVAMTRMAARIRAATTAEPTVAQLLASWFRPLAAAVVAVAVIAGISLAAIGADESAPYEAPLEITVAGDVYRVD
ncbi:MAG TPA: hypothetical protein VGF48_26455 [Thermoanaerobaculia bacterium]|jgi:hypothetical protein